MSDDRTLNIYREKLRKFYGVELNKDIMRNLPKKPLTVNEFMGVK